MAVLMWKRWMICCGSVDVDGLLRLCWCVEITCSEVLITVSASCTESWERLLEGEISERRNEG